MARRKVCFYVLIFSLLALVPLTAESVFPESLTVGIALFRGSDLPPAWDYLQESLPSLLKEYIEECDFHTLSLREFEEFWFRDFTAKQEALRESIRSKRQERDKLLFSTGEVSGKYETLTEEIEEKVEELEALVFNSPSYVESSIPLEFADENQSGDFLDPLTGDPEYRKDEGLDYLVWGQIENYDGLLYLYLEVYSYISGKPIYYRETAFIPEQADSVVEEEREAFWDLFLGKEWSRLTVNSEPSGSLISLDSGETAASRLESGFIDPGAHTLEISAYGYKSLSEALSLSPGEEVVYTYTLEPFSLKRIPVRSYPQGADVYIGSQWAGKTPLFLDVSGDFTRILLRKEGYDDYSYYIAGERSQDMNITLNRSVLNRDSYVEERRDRFYRSLGTFFLSIPVSVFLYSGYTVYSSAFLSEDTTDGLSDEERRLYNIGNLSYYGAFGSIYVNLVLFCDLVFKAVDYVNAAGQTFKE